MGIRLHKVLGYGFSDLKVEEGQIVDPRVNMERMEAASFELIDYYSWLAEQVGEGHISEENADFLFLKAESKLTGWIDNVQYRPDVDYGDLDVGWLLVTPWTMMGEWTRFDDPIDYALLQQRHIDEGQSGDPAADTVTMLDFAPFPHEGGYRDTVTGQLLNTNKVTSLQHLQKLGKTVEADAVTRNWFGYSSYAEFEANLNVAVPESLKFFTQWAGLFDDADLWMRMKPMMVTYWS